jgi:hypothetical protein
MSSNLKKFNTALRDFVGDLRNIIPSGDSSVIALESVVEITKINARIVITYFQEIVLKPQFLQNIMQENADFFIEHNYEEYVANSYGTVLMDRLKTIACNLKESGNAESLTMVFRWFKLLIFYSMVDLGLDAKAEMLKYASPSS